MATSAGGHLHMVPHAGGGGVPEGELGAPQLTTLPADPRERVLAVFPLLPAVYLTPAAVRRISSLIDDRHHATAPELRAEAEDALKSLEEVHLALDGVLAGEGFPWRGSAVRARDILAELAGALAVRGGLATPATRRHALGGGKAATPAGGGGGGGGSGAGGGAGGGDGTGGGGSAGGNGQPEQIGHRFLTG